MKKIFIIMIIALYFSLCIKVNAKAYRYEWENTIIYIPVGESINNYKNDPVANLYIDNVHMTDAKINYLIDGDWLCYLADVDTSVVGEYEVWYKAYENDKYKPGTCPGYKCKIKFIVQDKEAPSVKVINKNVRLRRNTIYDISSNLIITDNYSSELSIRDMSSIDYTRLGEYEACVVVIDEKGNEAYADFTVSIYEDSYPTIINKNEGIPINIEVNSVVDLTEYFTAYDEIDGDLTADISYPFIDTSNVGMFEYEVVVENKVGMETRKSFYVNIIDDKEPEITLTNEVVLLDYSEDFQSFDFSKYVAQIKDNLPIDYSKLSIKTNIENKVGNYNVWYEYNDGVYIATAVLAVHLRSYDKPLIIADDISISTDDDFDILEHISIEDPSDENVLKSIEIFDDNVDYNTPGEYYIEVYVINSSGVSATKRIRLEISENSSSNVVDSTTIAHEDNKYFIIAIVVLVGIIGFLSIKRIKSFKKSS